MAGPEGFYRARLSKRSTKLFLVPGDLQVSSQGGTAVGPFAATVRAAAPLLWTNREQLSVVERRKGLAVEWKDADPRRPVLIAAVSVDRLSTAAYACLCAAPAGAGGFTIPAAMLANLPSGSAGAGLPSSIPGREVWTRGMRLLWLARAGGSIWWQARKDSIVLACLNVLPSSSWFRVIFKSHRKEEPQ